MPGAARHVRHGRGHDERTGVGLLSAGARSWHLPARPPGRHRRGPGHPVAMGRKGTQAGRTDTGVTGSAEADGRLHRLLGGEPLAGTVTLTDAAAEQRQAVARLTGRPARSGVSLSVSLPEVDRILRESGAAAGGLAEAVTRLTGPVRDRGRDRADTAAGWAAAFAPLDDAVAGRAELTAWRRWLDATGVVRRLAPAPATARAL